MSCFVRWVTCPTCDGTTRVWETLKGSNVRATTACPDCFGGVVQVRMTKEEVLAALEQSR